ncbi:hypothetical protein PybrP1_004680 [[Pythium] brassicae (nom. inval.)]|nr:hypothetical protein PybrP1_004680 [[Pythium] brassicae (nom. inval.)]
MVCERCEEKLSKLVVPDKWSDSKESGGSSGGGGKDGSRTRRLKKRAERVTPVQRKCRLCKCDASRGAHYCNACAYKKGICSMCGRKVLDTKEFNMSS